jgi:hypothetical protein
VRTATLGSKLLGIDQFVTFEFDVGTTERHVVRVGFNRWSNSITVSVDGRRIHRDVPGFWIPKVRHWDVRVGESEKHGVEIEVVRSTWLKFKTPTYNVSVDGSIVDAK